MLITEVVPPGGKRQFPCLTIIYCPSRKDVDKVSEELLAHRAEMIHQMELYLGYK